MRQLLLALSLLCLLSEMSTAGERSDGFHRCPDDGDWSGHFVDGIQVGALKHSTGDYFAYDRYADAWTRSAVSPRLMRSPGLVGNRKGHGEGWFIGQQPVGEWEARSWIEGNANVPDDVGKPSLTIIGPAPARENVARDLVNDPSLRTLAARFVTQLYDPHDPMIVASGHQRGGQPTIYAQSPRGEVMLRDDKYHGPQQLSAALVRVLEMNDEQRRPQPDYQPLFDPSSSALIKPQINMGPWWTVLIAIVLIPFGVVLLCVLLGMGVLSAFLAIALGKRLYAWAAPQGKPRRK